MMKTLVLIIVSVSSGNLLAESAQELIVKHSYRPRFESVEKKSGDEFRKLKLVKVEGDFDDRSYAKKIHFSEDGTFDQIYTSRK
jgi:sulfate/thiosulfate transport system substrate-binding protein